MESDLALGPVSQQERIGSVDIVRGFALLGILTMNITAFGLADGIDYNPYALGPTSRANVLIWALRLVICDGKMRALFSMLFGAGVILLTGRAESRGAAAQSADVFTRRNMWLVLFGLIHAYFLWFGDVLYMYGVTALLFLYPCRKLSARTLITAGLAVLALLAGWRTIRMENRIHQAQKVAAAEAAARSGQALTDGQKKDQKEWQNLVETFHPDQKTIDEQNSKMRAGYLSVFQWNTSLNVRIQSLLYYRLGFCDPLGMMLIGMGLLRAGFLSAQLPSRIYGLIVLAGYGVGLPLGSLMAWIPWHSGFDSIVCFKWLFLPYDLQRLCVALAHASVLLLLIRAGAMPWLMKRLAAVGQTALSNYLGTTVICVILFDGFGFGLYGKLQLSQLMLVVLAVWCVNLIASIIWLKCFRFGPVEWLWRSLTYWQLEPLRRQQS
jgi:uncharacterized protein